jgi:inositol phosphorylceramide mannosyltransferase catalytic subunit
VYADLDTECIRDTTGLFADYNVSTTSYADVSAKTNTEESTRADPYYNHNMTAFFGRLGTNNSFEHSIPNAWMASEPRHPFFLLTLKWARATISKGGGNIYPEAITGPVALRNNIFLYEDRKYHGQNLQKSYLGVKEDSTGLYPPSMTRPQPDISHNVVVLPFHYVYPYSHERDGEAFRDFCWVNKPTFNATRCKDLVAVDHWPSYTITYWSHTWTESSHDETHLKNVN